MQERRFLTSQLAPVRAPLASLALLLELDRGRGAPRVSPELNFGAHLWIWMLYKLLEGARCGFDSEVLTQSSEGPRSVLPNQKERVDPCSTSKGLDSAWVPCVPQSHGRIATELLTKGSTKRRAPRHHAVLSRTQKQEIDECTRT